MLGAEERLLLKKMNARKIRNLANLWASFQWSKRSGKILHRGLPFSLSVEPSTTCNLRCPECPSGLRSFSRPTGNMISSTLDSLLDEIGDTLSYINFYFQGEPFLNPNFLELAHRASQSGVFCSTSTNAHYITEKNVDEVIDSGLDKIIISIDGTTQETYESYRRGGRLEKVLDGSRLLVEAKKRQAAKAPHLVFQFLVVKPNEHQVPEVFELAREIGVDEVKLKTAQLYDYENGNELMPENEEYSRYVKGPDGKFQLKNSYKDSCWRMWQGCVLTWDGKVVPCCFDKDAHHSLGTFPETTFKEIWRSSAYEEFRKAVFSGRDQIEICRNCTEGTKVFA
jgi:radical SAM protein with 4Fe4S-binding SPASM domain